MFLRVPYYRAAIFRVHFPQFYVRFFGFVSRNILSNAVRASRSPHIMVCFMKENDALNFDPLLSEKEAVRLIKEYDRQITALRACVYFLTKSSADILKRSDKKEAVKVLKDTREIAKDLSIKLSEARALADLAESRAIMAEALLLLNTKKVE